MPYQPHKQGKYIYAFATWWETDRNRLAIIRFVAYALFAASVAGTVYSAIKSVLPTWAVTLYAAFAVQLVFMTFMYAIKHSGEEDIRHALYLLRAERVAEWKLERDMLAELARFAFCTSSSIDPGNSLSSASPRRLGARKPIWPPVDTRKEVCRLTRQALETKIANIEDARVNDRPPAESDLLLQIDFIAYSAETLISLSRDVTAEMDDLLQGSTRYEGSIRVRILVRDTSESSEWLVPIALDQHRDVQYASDLRTRFRNVRQSALREFEESLKVLFSPKQVHFHVRGYRTEPLIKGILIDGVEGIFGLYTIDELKNPDGWDYSGHAVTMSPCNIAGDFVQSTAAYFYKVSFNQLWESMNLTTVVD